MPGDEHKQVPSRRVFASIEEFGAAVGELNMIQPAVLASYRDAFADGGVMVNYLTILEEADLADLGVKSAPHRRIIMSVFHVK